MLIGRLTLFWGALALKSRYKHSVVVDQLEPIPANQDVSMLEIAMGKAFAFQFGSMSAGDVGVFPGHNFQQWALYQ